MRPSKERLLEVVTCVEPGSDDVTFTHAVFAQCFLPIRKLPKSQKLYEVRHGRAALAVLAGRFGERIIVAVADAADRWCDVRLCKALGVLDREILHPPVAMVDEAISLDRPPFVESLLQGIENEVGPR